VPDIDDLEVFEVGFWNLKGSLIYIFGLSKVVVAFAAKIYGTAKYFTANIIEPPRRV